MGFLYCAWCAFITIGFSVVETSSRRGLVTWAPVFAPGRADRERGLLSCARVAIRTVGFLVAETSSRRGLVT